MAKNTTEEAKSVDNKGGNSLEAVKNELGPLGYIGMIAGAVVIIGALVFYYIDSSKNKKNATAYDELFQAEYYYGQDSLDLALNGDGRNLGLLSIIDIYGGTDAANLANFYAGAIYLKQNNPSSALDYLEDFSTSEVIADSKGKELMGDAYMELGQYSDAAAKYESAASTVDDEFYSPGYLLKAALAYENNNDMASALEAVSKVVDKYYGASEYVEAKKQKARLEALTSR